MSSYITSSYTYAYINIHYDWHILYIRLHRCWWRMLETKCVGDKFEMLVTDSGCWWPISYIEKITNITKKVANILILSPISQIGHHNKVINITITVGFTVLKKLHQYILGYFRLTSGFIGCWKLRFQIFVLHQKIRREISGGVFRAIFELRPHLVVNIFNFEPFVTCQIWTQLLSRTTNLNRTNPTYEPSQISEMTHSEVILWIVVWTVHLSKKKVYQNRRSLTRSRDGQIENEIWHWPRAVTPLLIIEMIN